MPDPKPTLEKIRAMLREEYGIEVGEPPSLLEILGQVIWPKEDVVAEGKRVAQTRSGSFHRNFGGWRNWRFIVEKHMRKELGVGWYVLGRFFGRLVFIDTSMEECWIKPRLEIPKKGHEGSKTYNIRIGWLYWCLCITKVYWYPNPRRYMPGFKDLPYYSEALAARYYLHDFQEYEELEKQELGEA